MGSGHYQHGFAKPDQAILNALPWAHSALLLSPLDRHCHRWKLWQRLVSKINGFKHRLTPWWSKFVGNVLALLGLMFIERCPSSSLGNADYFRYTGWPILRGFLCGVASQILTNRTIHRQVLLLSIPMVLSNITIPLLGLVDAAVIGHLQHAWYLGGVALGAC